MGDQMDTWAEAEREATFGFYEVVTPAPDDRWAGGYGHGATVSLDDGSDRVPVERVVSLEVMHRIGDAEVRVNTAVVVVEAPPVAQMSWLRQSCMYSLTNPLYDMDATVELPIAAHFSSADREIEIDGVPHVFEGIAAEINGESSGWAGFTRLGDRYVTVVIRYGEVDDLALATVTNPGMLDRPSVMPR